MPLCVSCGESVPPGMALCPMCGHAMSGLAPSAAVLETIPMGEVVEGIPISEARQCSACRKSYDALYADAFCECGGQLIDAPEIVEMEAADTHDGTSTARVVPSAEPEVPVDLPRLALYDADKNPITHFSLTKDVTLIGRLDAVEGVFPDIDVTEWLGKREARRVSRQHALIIRSRHDDVIRLRPLPGNTGTQIEGELVEPMTDHVLRPGSRIILGGVVRLKYEENQTD